MPANITVDKLYTIDDFLDMEKAGAFPPDVFFELIWGRVVQMPDVNPIHCGRVNKLNRLFTSKLGESVVVSVQNHVSIPGPTPMSLPRPDVAVLKPLPEFFGPWAPVPDEVLILVEVAETSLHYDRKTKLNLYAEAGIAEYWVLNIPGNVLEVYTQPEGGDYRNVQMLHSGQTVSPVALPGVTFAVDDILK